jgi:hypothetical protein
MTWRGTVGIILALIVGLGLLGTGFFMLRWQDARVAPAGGIAGQVMIGPTCPVVRDGEACPDRPFTARLLVRPVQGASPREVRADAQGRFRVALPPGVYIIEPEPEGIAMAPHQEVTVAAGAWTAVTISYDSGIR